MMLSVTMIAKRLSASSWGFKMKTTTLALLLTTILGTVTLAGCDERCDSSCSKGVTSGVTSNGIVVTTINSNDNCPLTVNGALTKEALKEAEKLISELEVSKDTLEGFKKAEDDGDVTIFYQTKGGITSSACITGSNSYCSRGFGAVVGSNAVYCDQWVRLGKLRDFHEVLNQLLRKRIEIASCKLRSMGVDVPRP